MATKTVITLNVKRKEICGTRVKNPLTKLPFLTDLQQQKRLSRTILVEVGRCSAGFALSLPDARAHADRGMNGWDRPPRPLPSTRPPHE
ncbi:hypothetical protein CDAR_419851 [Caerostris darwini]|uniref:Uncharacterized protein n=1 Tax=Caerostris darwini TaxID=1538125 RepID=A0AAV4UH67_9ARAC|nr:hypothetical protein CDAR_419851 [Caerostris darwini]